MSKLEKGTKYKGEEVKVNWMICMWDFWTGKVGKINSHDSLINQSLKEELILRSMVKKSTESWHITEKNFNPNKCTKNLVKW